MSDYYGKGWSYADVWEHIESNALHEREQREANQDIYIHEGAARASEQPQPATISSRKPHRSHKRPNALPELLGAIVAIILLCLIAGFFLIVTL